MYELTDYDGMLSDDVRSEAYLAAIARTVRPGDVVVEIGTGVGYFAIAAVRAGARRVYAIETNPAVMLGPAVAAANDCADRITFIRGSSRAISLPERGDVLLTDLHGLLPLNGDHIPSIVDARARLLQADARIIPQCDTLHIAPVELPEESGSRYLKLAEAPYGINRGPMAKASRSVLTRIRVGADDLLAPSVEWGRIEFATVESPDLLGSATWSIVRAGRLDGICVWFDADLGQGAALSNAPGLPSPSYGRGIFPMREPVQVAVGDCVRATVRAKLVEGEYIFAWETRVDRTGSQVAPIEFRQSTLDATVLSRQQLLARRDDHRPEAGANAFVLADLIALMDGVRSLRDIAVILKARYPGRFSSDGAALAYVTARSASLAEEDPYRLDEWV